MTPLDSEVSQLWKNMLARMPGPLAFLFGRNTFSVISMNKMVLMVPICRCIRQICTLLYKWLTYTTSRPGDCKMHLPVGY